MYFKWTLIALMKYYFNFKIIIHVFQMDINCILMFKIIIHAFQIDINYILMKYYFHVSNGHSLHFNEILF